MLRLKFVLLLTIALLAGCGQVTLFGHVVGDKQEVDPESILAIPAAQESAVPAAQSVMLVRAVTLVLSPQAETQVADDSRFNAQALLAAVKAELLSRKLLDEADAQASTAEISIDDFGIRPTSNAVVFGYIPSTGILNGEVRVRDAGGTDLQSFRIEARSQLTIAASGEDANPLKPLYRRFAVMAGDNLSGKPTRSEEPNDQRAR